jgi:type VI secretion system protein ImpF
MPADDRDEPMMPSILSRLLDPESMRSARSEGYRQQEVVDSIRFDLEDLFNTRQSGVTVPRQFTQVQNSIVTYGMPDLTYFDINNNSQCDRICRALAVLIQRFEPRLRNVRATVVKTASAENDRQVRFHIEGQLAVEAAPEVDFDTVVELATGRAAVAAKAASS